MIPRRLTAALVAGALGAGLAVACNDRENVDESNDAQKTSEGSKQMTRTSEPAITPTDAGE
jgi:hypothetical protein